MLKVILIIALFISISTSCSSQDVELWYTQPEFTEVIQTKCNTSIIRNKSIGILGGSISRSNESQIGKKIWKKFLNVEITDYGQNGYGFSSKAGSIQNCIKDIKYHDIYILWCSTNDQQQLQPIGEASDFTITDNYNLQKLDTQCGGINYCIQVLKKKFPNSTIILFTSLPYFANPTGYEPKKDHKYLYSYVKKQIECAKKNNIKYLNQWECNDFTSKNYKNYYLPDKIHLNENGYISLAYYQLLFFSSIKE